MAINTATLKTRSLTAIIFLVVMLTGLLLSEWSFYLLFFIVYWGCWLEYDKLVKRIYPAYTEVDLRTTSIVKIMGLGFLITCLPHTFIVFDYPVFYFGWMILFVGLLKFIVGITKEKDHKMLTIKIAGFGLIYIALTWGLFINLRHITWLNYPIGYVAALCLVAAIWINDTMQYLVGSLIGKTPFSSISPNKTLEGTIGGSLLCVIVVSLSGYFFVNKELLWIFLFISLIAAIVGTLGDLLESKLKRMAGVKDSGNFMPGHGGFLDRFDSLILSAPIVWLLIVILYGF